MASGTSYREVFTSQQKARPRVVECPSGNGLPVRRCMTLRAGIGKLPLVGVGVAGRARCKGEPLEFPGNSVRERGVARHTRDLDVTSDEREPGPFMRKKRRGFP